jgi:hypothetical protein
MVTVMDMSQGGGGGGGGVEFREFLEGVFVVHEREADAAVVDVGFRLLLLRLLFGEDGLGGEVEGRELLLLLLLLLLLGLLLLLEGSLELLLLLVDEVVVCVLLLLSLLLLLL